MALIDDVSIEDLARFVQESNRISEVALKIGYKPSGKSESVVSARLKHLGFSTSHFKNWNTLASVPTLELLIINSSRNNQTLKKRIIKENIIPYECSKCNNKGIWLGNILVLQMDHTNGDPTDNRLINLRFLCPNCHSQTDTYGGRNNKKIIE